MCLSVEGVCEGAFQCVTSQKYPDFRFTLVNVGRD